MLAPKDFLVISVNHGFNVIARAANSCSTLLLLWERLTNLERQFLAAALAPGISVDPHWLHRMPGDKTIESQAQERLQAMGLLTANSPRLCIDPGLRELARMGADEISVKEQFIHYLETMLEMRSLDWTYCIDELGNILGMIDWAAKHQRWGDVIAFGQAKDPYLSQSTAGTVTGTKRD